MSWWVSLQRNEETVEVPEHREGGTYVMGGTKEASLNVTYNYGEHFRETLGGKGLWDLNGVKGRDAVPFLETAVASLGTVRDDDYWASTSGNAGFALAMLLAWARLHPDAVFRVS